MTKRTVSQLLLNTFIFSLSASSIIQADSLTSDALFFKQWLVKTTKRHDVTLEEKKRAIAIGKKIGIATATTLLAIASSGALIRYFYRASNAKESDLNDKKNDTTSPEKKPESPDSGTTKNNGSSTAPKKDTSKQDDNKTTPPDTIKSDVKTDHSSSPATESKKSDESPNSPDDKPTIDAKIKEANAVVEKLIANNECTTENLKKVVTDYPEILNVPVTSDGDYFMAVLIGGHEASENDKLELLKCAQKHGLDLTKAPYLLKAIDNKYTKMVAYLIEEDQGSIDRTQAIDTVKKRLSKEYSKTYLDLMTMMLNKQKELKKK